MSALPASNGGLGLSTMRTSIIFLITILVLVVYMTATQKAARAPQH
ncbi:MAG: hypothetical protein JWQ21_2883 [Herminiimonas sp.]|jgi:uncharacterized membrane-anchored protein|nr:hypothetical protein [Herminiimonas sp.]